MTEETADQATDALEGFLEDLPGTRADLPAEVEVRRSYKLRNFFDPFHCCAMFGTWFDGVDVIVSTNVGWCWCQFQCQCHLMRRCGEIILLIPLCRIPALLRIKWKVSLRFLLQWTSSQKPSLLCPTLTKTSQGNMANLLFLQRFLHIFLTDWLWISIQDYRFFRDCCRRSSCTEKSGKKSFAHPGVTYFRSNMELGCFVSIFT